MSPLPHHQDLRSHYPDRTMDSLRKPSHSRQPHLPSDKVTGAADSKPSTTNFVKKVYKMLENTSFSHVVSWGPQGDCFVVRDINEFTRTLLPRMFNHSNFASFVRQLNKYDFHKVKNTESNQFGEPSWTFRHPDFHAGHPDALDNIKRKVPPARKSTGRAAAAAPSHVNGPPNPGGPDATIELLQQQINHMVRAQEQMIAHINTLEGNYLNVLNEVVNFRTSIAHRDVFMQYLLWIHNGQIKFQEPAGWPHSSS